MSNFRKGLVNGFKQQVINKNLSDEILIENLINSNICPHQLGLEGGCHPEHCQSECSDCWNEVYIQYN